MFSPGQAWVTVGGVVQETIKFSDSHEAQDAARKLASSYPPTAIVFVQFENGQPEIWEDFI